MVAETDKGELEVFRPLLTLVRLFVAVAAYAPSQFSFTPLGCADARGGAVRLHGTRDAFRLVNLEIHASSSPQKLLPRMLKQVVTFQKG